MSALRAAPKAILIAGPTASGKSELALRLAEQFGGVVVNADSMQIYRELSILTARPGLADLSRAPHALYGFVPAAKAFSVGDWLGAARAELAVHEQARRLPIIVGGTGLYFEALLKGLSPTPPIPSEVRVHWRGEAARLGPAALYAELSRRDAPMAERLRPSDPQRVTRALEVLDATGRSLAEWQAIPGEPALAPAETLRLVLAPDRAALYARCDARFEEMMAAGGLDEARALGALGLSPDLPAMRATGARQLIAHLRGATPLAVAVESAKAATRQYAKRQATWIRGRMADWIELPLVDANQRARAAAELVHDWRRR